ncbi:MAG: fluoride efflux transporter CrcB [Candidatus Gastranaerophilaceae bacterium]|jgi:CrcB protein
MTGFIAVFLGGSLGASLRYLISLIAHNYGWSYQGTFIINIVGCLFLGFVTYIALQKEKTFNSNLKLFLTTGVAGGFTTFSTFSYEAFTLIKSGQIITGLIYMLLSCIIGLIATLFGIFLAKQILALKVEVEDPNFEEEL